MVEIQISYVFIIYYSIVTCITKNFKTYRTAVASTANDIAYLAVSMCYYVGSYS